MTVPLIILGDVRCLRRLSSTRASASASGSPLEHWLEPVFEDASEGAVLFAHGNDAAWAEHMTWPLAAGGFLAFVIGSGVAYWMYVVRGGEPARQLATAQPGLHQLLLDKWRIDELYDVTVLGRGRRARRHSAAVDKTLVDGLLARLTALVVAALGTVLRAFQNGVVHVYAAMMVVGLAVVGWFFVVPHAERHGRRHRQRRLRRSPPRPGMGYAYRWDADGDGKPDNHDFGGTQTLKVHLEPGKIQTVQLEVKNAFGLVRSEGASPWRGRLSRRRRCRGTRCPPPRSASSASTKSRPSLGSRAARGPRRPRPGRGRRGALRRRRRAGHRRRGRRVARPPPARRGACAAPSR